MKKNNQKGFMLVEAFIISTVVLGILVFMFVQIRTITSGFNRSFSYNTVPGIYIANELGEFIKENNYDDIITFVETVGYHNLSSLYVGSDEKDNSYNTLVSNIWKKMLSKANVKTVVVSKEPMVELKQNSEEWLSSDFKSYINSVAVNNYDLSYRIIVEFNDETYATLRLA